MKTPKAAGGVRLAGVRVATRRIATASLAALGLACAAPASADDQKIPEIVTSVCAACHGLDGIGVAPTFPKLAGLHPEYIANELRVFRSGKRKSDIMAPIVAGIDPRDYKALGEYYGRQKPAPGTVLDRQAADAGRKLYLEGNEQTGVPACAGCHEDDASGGKRFPRLAGQHREYLLEQMEKFRKDVRNNDSAHVMRALAKRMTDFEIKSVVEFLVGL